MGNQLATVKYTVSFFSDKEKFVDLTEEQYEKLKKLMTTNKLVEIGGSLVNVNDIAGIERGIVEPNDWYCRINGRTFYSEAEVEEYYKNM